mmetsp:Transcript_24222/g.62433  ORF Transcript_24222/g.62433 Transcript_24222/m.62433 type:complete len:224 (+) Transcript_24222:935-1606(+)
MQCYCASKTQQSWRTGRACTAPTAASSPRAKSGHRAHEQCSCLDASGAAPPAPQGARPRRRRRGCQQLLRSGPARCWGRPAHPLRRARARRSPGRRYSFLRSSSLSSLSSANAWLSSATWAARAAVSTTTVAVLRVGTGADPKRTRPGTEKPTIGSGAFPGAGFASPSVGSSSSRPPWGMAEARRHHHHWRREEILLHRHRHRVVVAVFGRRVPQSGDPGARP